MKSFVWRLVGHSTLFLLLVTVACRQRSTPEAQVNPPTQPLPTVIQIQHTPTAPPTETLSDPTLAIPSPTGLPDMPLPTPIEDITRTRAIDNMVMVSIPSGTFEMGSSDKEIESDASICMDRIDVCEKSWFEDQKPVHRVRLNSYWIDQTEITNEQYQLCVQEGSCTPPSTDANAGNIHYSSEEYAHYPVVGISWTQAQAYCSWAGGRLPSEAEWEYAARGPNSFRYPWGNIFDGSQLNFCDANCNAPWRDTTFDDGYADLAPTGSYPSGTSWAGALDMAGNVWEWTGDWYGRYASEIQENPTGPSTGENRVIRGGSFQQDQPETSSAFRDVFPPDQTLSLIGFRCVTPEK